MTWFKVDDGFWSHPKTSTLPAPAIALWVKAGAYSCQHLTDGRITPQVLRLLGSRKSARDLVSAGLWYEVDDGWEFHDWSEYQETSSDVRKRREEAKERQRRSREARTHKQRESQAKSHGMSRVTDEVTSQEVSYPRPDPTRPDHSFSYVEEGGSPTEHAGDPPPPRCSKHTDELKPPPCGACADARRAREEWDAAQTRHRADAARNERHALAELARDAINACTLCDDNGYRGNRVCNHDPDTEARAARGLALVRAQLSGKAGEA
ncbi:hypothetical protein SEA_VASANTI_65 [Gordonia phage Vasanti]|uniref:Helix-turn-helix DNA binding domain protein n=1 Tax=Gordonia phage Vasanti TaxID=2502431 RepID=A0A411BW16_9CAUD|nr:HNH endonuclease [Gordonia phage Vasanti]QAY05803.1 hypothetical protein SEA_VASANTI_65 [Gordonia phage Vasanti]